MIRSCIHMRFEGNGVDADDMVCVVLSSSFSGTEKI